MGSPDKSGEKGFQEEGTFSRKRLRGRIQKKPYHYSMQSLIRPLSKSFRMITIQMANSSFQREKESSHERGEIIPDGE